MKRCITCEGLLPDTHFDKGSPICTVCVGKLQKAYHVEYSNPERKTVKEAYVSLLVAIREQSIKDESLEDWEEYWMKNPRWSRVWGLLEYTIGQSEQMSSHSNIRIGRHL